MERDRPSLCLGIAYSPLPMATVQGAGHHLRDLNKAFCLLVGKSKEKLIGQPFAKQVPATAGTLEVLERVYRANKPESHTERQPAAPPLLVPLYWSYVMWAVPATDEHPAEVVIQVTETVRFDSQATAMNEALMLSAVRQHELAEVAEASNTQLQVEITKHLQTARELEEARTILLTHAGELERTVEKRTAQLRESIVDLEAFSYSVAHDLRAPVRAIRGFTEFAVDLCRKKGDPGPIVLLEKVIGAATRMDRLILDVLTLSAISRDRLAFSTVDVDRIVRLLIQERPGLAPPVAEIEVKSPLHAVRGHEASFTQCLTNLLDNSIKFVAPGVVPRVRIWSEELPPSPAAALDDTSAPSAASRGKNAPKVRLWIEDNGIGIPAKSQQRIFEIFQRLHGPEEYEGTGVGLAIVRKAIQRMGGQVGVVSEPGKGSRFWLELPKA